MKKLIRLITPDKLGPMRRIIGILIIVFCLFFTYYFWNILQSSNDSTATARFDLTTDSAVHSIEHSLEVYSDVLYSGRALLIVNPSATRAEWDAFIGAQNISERYPGIATLAYIEEVTSDQVNEITSELNASRLPSEKDPITVYPKPLDERIAIVKYTNGTSVGYNMLSDAKLSQVLSDASSTGLPRAATLNSIHIGNRQFVGYAVIALAVYDKGFDGQATAVERRSHTSGYVTLSLKLDTLLKSAFDTVLSGNGVSLRMSTADGGVVYDNAIKQPTRRTITHKESIIVGGQEWSIEFSGPAEFGLSTREIWAPRIAFVGGILFMIMTATVYFYRSGLRIKLVERTPKE